MTRKRLKVAIGAFALAAGTAAPVSVRVTHATLVGSEPLVRENRACAATAGTGGAWACRPHAGYVCIVDGVVFFDVEPIWVPDAGPTSS